MFFDIAVRRKLGVADIAVAFAADSGLIGLFGPSGSGKTSVLNMIAGLLKPDAGRIVVAGEPLFDAAVGLLVPPQQRRAGYIFQDARLFPHLRVRDNLRYGWRIARPEQRWLAFEDAIAFLGIGQLLERWPRTLSGGEAQRVAIGRALLSGPRFLLMDEPLSSLDKPRREEIMGVVERIRDDLKLPILYVSHDRSELERLASLTVEL